MRSFLLTIFFGVFLSQSISAQYRIVADSLNTYAYRNSNHSPYSFLIDVPTKEIIDTLYISNQMQIPVIAFFNTRASTKLNVLMFERKSKQYSIRFGYRTDSSIIINEKYSKYNELKPYELKEDSLLVYYTESTGSACCPRDSIYDRELLRDFIKRYERDNNVRISDVYIRSIGKEGESISYLTLKGLTPRQKIKFIRQRWWSLVPNKHLKDFVETPSLYIPFVISKKGLKKLD